MATFQEVIDDARILLLDDDKARYTDAQALVAANECLSEIRRFRPDLFLGSLSTLATYDLSDTVPIDSEYHVYLKNYIIARTQLRDDDPGTTERASVFMTMFRVGLLGTAAGGA